MNFDINLILLAPFLTAATSWAITILWKLFINKETTISDKLIYIGSFVWSFDIFYIVYKILG
jgi:hypothetical protein